MYGIIIGGSTDGYIKNSDIMYNDNYGLAFSGVDRYNLTNNTIKYNLNRDVYLYGGSTDNLIYDNNFEVNLMVVDDSGNDWNSSTKGNLWDNFDSDDEGCHNDSGYCAENYTIGGSAGAVAYYPKYTGVNGTIQTINCNSCDNCTALITNWTAAFNDTLNLTGDDIGQSGNCIDFAIIIWLTELVVGLVWILVAVLVLIGLQFIT